LIYKAALLGSPAEDGMTAENAVDCRLGGECPPAFFVEGEELGLDDVGFGGRGVFGPGIRGDGMRQVFAEDGGYVGGFGRGGPKGEGGGGAEIGV